MALDDLEQVHVSTREQWRAWLEQNAATSPGVWLVWYKKASAAGRPTYDEVVEEALCFGWIDSTVRTRDSETSLQLLTPRKANSTWSASNKERVDRLTRAGLMTELGLRAVQVAQGNGSWTLLETAERLEVPEDLRDALAADEVARRSFESFPPGARKLLLYWVISAKRADTRARRIAKLVSEAAEGRRAVG